MNNEAMTCKCDSETTSADRPRKVRVYVPNVDIVENEREVRLVADVPGVKRENLSIDYERGVLTIHGRVSPRHEPDGMPFAIREYGVGDYKRAFTVGDAIDADKIEADLRDGVLTLHLPKREHVLPRKIAISAN